MRIECLFRGAHRMLRKSASRIVASRHLVKKSLRLASILFATTSRRIDSGSLFFTYALSMDYVLGFDGGGTKTECVLIDPAGKILARCFSGPSNPSRVGVEPATREIDKAANLSLQEARVARNAVAALGAGLAGTGKPEMKERMRASLAGAFPGAAVSIFTDLEVALAAAGEGPVIVLVAGTGSAAIGRNAQGQIWRTGGQGPRFGDDGSAFPIVAAAADAGDPAAREILVQAAGDLSSLVHAVAEHSGHGRENIMIVKTGGTVGRCAFFDVQLDAALKRALPQAQIGGLRMSPAEAAARAARY